jgi:AraC family transcriptional regulator
VIPGARYAVCQIAVPNPDGCGVVPAIDQLGQAANFLYGTWLPESGYELADQPGLEIYRAHHPEFQVEFCLPVRPA